MLGQRLSLRIRRFASAGAFLGVDDDAGGETILLPAREVPEGAGPGDEVEVFVHLDSEERPIATTTMPRLALGEVTFLEVTAITEFGAFVDWGLGKELLVPFAQQSRPLRVIANRSGSTSTAAADSPARCSSASSSTALLPRARGTRRSSARRGATIPRSACS